MQLGSIENRTIWFSQLSLKCKLASVRVFKADVLSVNKRWSGYQ